MSEKLKESLSAVIDGEADEFELRRVLDEIGKDSSLASSWERYHLIGSVMRRERVSSAAAMREEIWAEVNAGAAVPNQPALVTEASIGPAQRSAPTFGRWASIAVAASVAFAVVVGFNDLTGFGDDGITDVAGSEAAVAVPLSQAIRLKDEITQRDQTRIEAYMISHAQHVAMNQPGLGGFAKMVAYEKH